MCASGPCDEPRPAGLDDWYWDGTDLRLKPNRQEV